MKQRVTLFLDDALRKSAASGRHNFIGHLISVLQQEGSDVRLASPADATNMGRGITHMTPPPPGGLTFRRVYHYPFWAIETTAARWDWQVAKSSFPAETVSEHEAQRLYRRWQNRLFPGIAQDTSRDGFVYVPLQGQLLRHRSFQTCSPIEMLFLTLQSDPDREVFAALHPGETYSPAELNVLEALAESQPRLSIRTGGMEDMLRRCDYVVTMNSSAAFNGYFFGKPCILFAQIDFHHIALKATPDDLSAFEKVVDHVPDYARYLLWFWQDNAINAGRPDVRDQIRAALSRCGWPIAARPEAGV